MNTYCTDCDMVHGDTKGKEPWHWRCLAVPVPPGYGFVNPTYSPTPPYARCIDVNGGNCPHFRPARKMEAA